MTNIINKNPIYVDTVGVVMTTPLWIKKIVLAPTATTSTATLRYWIEDDSHFRANKIDATVAVTGGDTITADELFHATEVVATDAIKIYKADLAANVGTWQVVTVPGGDDSVTVAPAITNDTTGIYSWKTYASYPLTIISTATFPNGEADFGPDGLLVPNLMVTVLTTGTLYIYL